jgi:hypothetical protein
MSTASLVCGRITGMMIGRREMSGRCFMLTIPGVAAAAVLVLAPRVAAGQVSQPGQQTSEQHRCASDDPAVFWRCAQERAAAFDPPRTADRRPDFSGYWRHGTEAKEDLEAPWDNRARVGVPREPQRDAGPGKSMIVDQPDGKLPLQSWAIVQKKENEARYIDQNTHCFLSGVPRFMYEAGAYQILHAPQSITIVSEEAHAYRVIAMDGRPRVAKNIRLWLGDSRGRWEGDTLVIETTNQNGRAFLDRRGTFYTDAATVTERFTMLDQNTIAYGATVEDPLVYTRPFTIAFMLMRQTTPGFEILEDACFEGNKDVENLYSIGLSKYPGIRSEDVPALKARTPGSR